MTKSQYSTLYSAEGAIVHARRSWAELSWSSLVCTCNRSMADDVHDDGDEGPSMKKH